MVRLRKTFSNRLTTRYLLIIRNEENFAEKTTFSFTYSKVIFLLMLSFLIILILSFFLVETLLAQWFDPRHVQMEANKRLVELSLKVDSLAYETEKKDRFILNFQRIVMGDSVELDLESYSNDSNFVPTKSNMDTNSLAQIDAQFREEFEESGVSLVSYNSRSSDLHEIFFYSPITGLVSGRYNVSEGHFGVDVVAKKNEPVKAVADGTVIFASWTQDSGHVITIQHRSNLISVYKHNAELLKKVGNFVSGGEIISIVGNTGELTDGPHLHFELWNDGNPVNPEDFVSF
ncbi:MAG: M23 family metallopeptidase [Cyclobacteriaceae bacterium]|nr:M23 family metallopeptidase [Cyclobacteriaceae bacterium]